MDHQWLSHGSCERSLAVRALVRAPKEEQWIANGQSHRTNGALAKWPEKANREALPLSPGESAAGEITVRNSGTPGSDPRTAGSGPLPLSQRESRR